MAREALIGSVVGDAALRIDITNERIDERCLRIPSSRRDLSFKLGGVPEVVGIEARHILALRKAEPRVECSGHPPISLSMQSDARVTARERLRHGKRPV